MYKHVSLYPERIVCITEEPTEILYSIGAGDRVVGISGFTVRPKEARQKPKVSTFLDANFERILDLCPDVVFGFSDLQADIARELIKRGVPVYIFNQRSVVQILQTIRVIGAIVGEAVKGKALAVKLARDLLRYEKNSRKFPWRPSVYFEEWDDPLICGIRWVSELIEIAGGDDIFKERRSEQGAKGRIVAADDVVRLNPDVIVASWCGKKVKISQIKNRPGWENVTAVRENRIYEIKSSDILQPGPAALTDGVRQLADIIASVRL